MRLTVRWLLCVSVALALSGAAPASAQYKRPQADVRMTGETYHVEFGIGWWWPPPDITVSVRALDLIGSDISAQRDLGLQSSRLTQYNLIIRPAKKHKFRFGYTPISYSADTVLTRTIVFNGQTYTVGLPINSTVQWNVWRFGYEYDFIYRSRGFLGVILEGQYIDASVNLTTPVASGFAQATAPIPTIGATGRYYLWRNLSVTGEFTAFKLPTSSGALQGYDGTSFNVNAYGTLNFTDNLAFQAGYQSMSVKYRKDLDNGDMVLRGPYIMAIARF